MKDLRAIAVAVALALTATAARAEGGEFQIIGVGGHACAAWTQAQRTPGAPAAIAQASWLGGYLTAYNNYQAPARGNVLSPDFDALENLMNRYCGLHPDSTIENALEVMIEVMKIPARPESR